MKHKEPTKAELVQCIADLVKVANPYARNIKKDFSLTVAINEADKILYKLEAPILPVKNPA